MAKKLRVGVLFGGRSGEHEVSLLSAASILKAIDRKKFDVVPIGITKEGHWLGAAAAPGLFCRRSKRGRAPSACWRPRRHARRETPPRRHAHADGSGACGCCILNRCIEAAP